MDNRFGFPHRITQDEYFQCKPERSPLETSAGMNLTTTVCGKFNEKDLMRGLNDRLAGFIEKVRHLEYQNHLLEREIEEIRGRAKPASCFDEEYGPELRKLRKLVQDISHQKHRIEIEHQNLEEDLSKLRKQHEQEARSRSDTESNIMVLKKDINDAYQAKLQLEKKAQALVDEIHFLKRNHEAEVSEMFDQIQNAQETTRVHEFGNSGITAALRDIRTQLGGHAVSDVQQAGETFRSQFARLTEAAETKRDALRATQQEIQDYRRRLQTRSIELDCAKGTREALEKQLHDVEDRHKEELIHYQNTIKELENELINCKFDMSSYLREYQDLLNVKMALDVEILSYRKLLCGEEARLSTGSDTHMSLPYIYHQSPVYTLPSLTRPGSSRRRVEPQYKFVEEIITETTREIELSEFEERGPEETEAEVDCVKRDGGSSEEENGDKDSREEEGEQVSDNQQSKVEPLEADDKNGGSPGEVEKDPESEDETEKTQTVDIDGSTNDNTQSEVLLRKDNEQHQKVDDNTKEEKEVMKVIVQKDLSTKPEDLKPDPVVEDEPEITVNSKKGDAEKDNFSSAIAKMPIDEIISHQLSSAVRVQDKVHVSETAEKPTGFTAEAESIVSVETGQVQVTSTTKSEEKEHDHTQPQANSKSEVAEGGEKVAFSNKSPAEETSLSFNEVKDQMPHSAGKTETAQTVLPKKKTSDKVEESHQETKESSQVQTSELIEGSEQTKNDPQD